MLRNERELIPIHKNEVRLRRRTSPSTIYDFVILHNRAEPRQGFQADSPLYAVPRKQQPL
jgi:hypothetical protein